jgi:hypothetical protein
MHWLLESAKGKLFHLGMFADPRLAAYVYDLAATRLFGPYACTNQQLGLLNPTTLTAQEIMDGCKAVQKAAVSKRGSNRRAQIMIDAPSSVLAMAS